MMGIGGFWMFPFFPIIILIVVLYLVFGRDHGRWLGHDAGESAIEILKKRYAKGEITEEEFEDIVCRPMNPYRFRLIAKIHIS